MCFYAEVHYKRHYVCVTCRVSFKHHPDPAVTRRCPRCAAPMLCAGRDFAAPPRRDVKAWSVVAVVLGEGLRYEGREICGCGREPKYRPRTRAQLRARVRESERTGTPLAETLARPEPSQPIDGAQEQSGQRSFTRLPS
jgi:hypothetical protein